MEMISVQSSQIAQVGHDGQSTLRVLFRRGGLYEYSGVTSAEFDELRAASSIGTYFGQRIKSAKSCTKVAGSEFAQTVTKTLPSSDDLDAIEAEKVVAQKTAYVAPEMENQEVQQVEQKVSLLVQDANTIKVTDATTQHHASQVLLAIAALRKEVADTFKPMKDAAFKAHRTVCEQEKRHDQPLAEAETAVKRQIGAFVQEQNRLAREAEETLRRVERERAEAEAREESDRQAIADAEVLQAMGDTVGAEAVLSNPAPAPVRYVAPAPVAPQVAQVQGVTTREDWDFRIVNFDMIPREYLLANESAIRSLGKTTKGKAKVAGVEFFPKPVVSASRGGRY